MFEVKVYESIEELIKDNESWFEDYFPYDTCVNEGDSQEIGENYETAEEVLKYIKESHAFHFKNWEKLIVARRKPERYIENKIENIIFAVLKYPSKNEEKFISKLKIVGEEFIQNRENSILILDNRDGLIDSIGYILEEELEESGSDCKKIYDNFKKLRKNDRENLYENYKSSCKEFGEKLDPYGNNKSIDKLKLYLRELVK